MRKQVLMIAYTDYLGDARIKREAGTLTRTSNFEIRVLCLQEGREKRSYLEDGVRVDELSIRKYAGNNPIGYVFSYLYFLVLSFLACTKHFLSRRVDIVHVHNMPNLLVFSALIPKLFGKRVILDMHDCMPEMFSIKFKKWNSLFFKLLRWEEVISCGFADKVICVNHVQRDVLVKRGINPGKLFVSMNVPDHRVFKRLQPSLRGERPDGRFNMVYHGTIARRLGVDLPIRAVAELRDTAPGMEFHFWGSGEFLRECQALSRQLGIEGRIHFNGVVKVEALNEALGTMHLGIVPNRKSSATEVMLPVKMLEYIMLGIPVLVPRLETIQYYFSEDEVGYFEPDDLESLKGAMLKIYGDESQGRRMAERAQRFLDQYGWEKQSADFIQLYESM
jgi:glycosyltransferase involved in cell wall biosynthesis